MNNERVPWSMVWMLCATATASYICRVNVSTAGALLMDEFHMSQIQMGQIFSAFLLGYAAFQIPAGMLADRIGARKLLTWAAWLWVAFTIAQSLIGREPFLMNASTVLIVFLVCRFLLGVCEAPTYTGAAEGMSRWVPQRFQGRATGIVIGSIGLGSALAPVIVSNTMVVYGWRTALMASTVPAFVVALIWSRMSEPLLINTSAASPQRTASTGSLRSAGFILLTISYTLQGYVGYIFVSWFYLYLVQERHFGLLTGAWMSSLPWILSIISIPLGGYLSDKLSGKLGAWGVRTVPILGMGLSGILISIGAHTVNPVIAAIALAFATALVLCVEGPFWATMMKLAGAKSGAAGGIMNMGSNLGGLISPALTPLLASYIGWENALHVAGALALIAAALWLGIRLDQPIPAK